MILRKYVQVMPWNWKKLPIYTSKCHEKQLSHVICKWWYAFEWIILRKYVHVMPWNWKKLPIYTSKCHENFEAMCFCFAHVTLTVTGRMTRSGSLSVVGTGIMHCLGTDPIRNPTIWLAESRNQVSQFAYRGRMNDITKICTSDAMKLEEITHLYI